MLTEIRLLRGCPLLSALRGERGRAVCERRLPKPCRMALCGAIRGTVEPAPVGEEEGTER